MLDVFHHGTFRFQLNQTFCKMSLSSQYEKCTHVILAQNFILLQIEQEYRHRNIVLFLV